MNILLTGIDGYVGWPTALRLAKHFPEARIIGVDNLARRRWVAECGSVSAIPIADMETRLKVAKAKGYKNISFIEGDLTDWSFVESLYSIYSPEVVIHLAAQPSAPYSQVNAQLASFTQFNNNQSTRNLLWGLHTCGLKQTHFIETTTMGVYGTPEFEIPEGFFTVEHRGRSDTIPFPNMAGSWYHVSKSNDINNLWLASRQFGLSVTDFRMAIIYGTSTEETREDPALATRFDFDYYFGVVGNRFCAQAVTNYPLTIYGKGLQRKPMISLEDAVHSLVKAVQRGPQPGYHVYNQVNKPVAIVELAHAIRDAAKDLGFAVEVKHFPNPRMEKEEHLMTVDNRKFLELLGKKPVGLEEGHRQILQELLPYRETLLAYKDRFLPDILK